MRPITTALLAFGFLTLMASGSSQSTQRDLCRNASNYDDVVKFCSAAIQSGKLSSNDLADAYWQRAYWSVSRHPDRAIRDYSQVVRLRPNEVRSFYWRELA